MSIKSRLAKLEREEPAKPLDPWEMTDLQLLAEIRKGRNYPPGYEPSDEELMEIIQGKEGHCQHEMHTEKSA